MRRAASSIAFLSCARGLLWGSLSTSRKGKRGLKRSLGSASLQRVARTALANGATNTTNIWPAQTLWCCPIMTSPVNIMPATLQNLFGSVAARVRVLRLAGLPEGGDVADWIAAGGTADQLAQAAELADEQKSDEPKAELTGWQSHVFTAAALRTMAFPPVSYIVPGIIPEGLTILAGRPKIGKSWMALDLALGIATGKPVLGGVHAEQGDVLYCCLEDNPRRLQRRITKLLSLFGSGWPERLALTTRWRRLDDGGVEDIEAWCDSVPKPRLVLLDTLAGVRSARTVEMTRFTRATMRPCVTSTGSPTIEAWA